MKKKVKKGQLHLYTLYVAAKLHLKCMYALGRVIASRYRSTAKKPPSSGRVFSESLTSTSKTGTSNRVRFVGVSQCE